MGPETDAAAIIAKRHDVLAALSTPMRKPELVDALGTSRSTVDRAIESLTEHGLVDCEGSEYVTTYVGREGCLAYERFLGRLGALERAQPVLETLAPTVDIDPAVLEGASVVESSPEAPEAPLEANLEYISDPTEFRGTGPTVLPRHIAMLDSFMERGVETELVLTTSTVDALSETYAEDFERLSDEDGLTLYVTDEPMPYAVWTADSPDRTASGIVVYDDTGVAGVVNNDTAGMNEWVQSQYERYRRGADRLV